MHIVTGELVTKPENQAILINKTAEMKCTTNEGTGTKLSWITTPPNSTDNIVLCNGWGLSEAAQDYIQFNHSSIGQYDLIIRGTRKAGQIYTCIEPRSHKTESAELVILESDPVCTSNSKDEYINAVCTIRFSGNWPPEMHWTLNGEDVPQEWAKIEIKRKESVTSNLLLPRNSATYLISCKTNFSERLRPSGTTARNVPTYTNTWQNLTTAMPQESPEINGRTGTHNIIIAIGCLSPFLFIAATVAIFFVIKRFCRHMRGRRNGQGHDEAEESRCSENGVLLRDYTGQSERSMQNGHGATHVSAPENC